LASPRPGCRGAPFLRSQSKDLKNKTTELLVKSYSGREQMRAGGFSNTRAAQAADGQSILHQQCRYSWNNLYGFEGRFIGIVRCSIINLRAYLLWIIVEQLGQLRETCGKGEMRFPQESGILRVDSLPARGCTVTEIRPSAIKPRWRPRPSSMVTARRMLAADGPRADEAPRLAMELLGARRSRWQGS
jgi:hypothetical protein